MLKLSYKFVRPIFNIYTAGENIQQLNNKINHLKMNNMFPIVDYIKEYSNQKSDIQLISDEYISLSKLQNNEYIAVKLSSFDFDEKIINKTISELIFNDKKILIDAENNKNQNKIDYITNNLIKDFNQKNIFIFKTYQMYRNDSYDKLYNDLQNYKNLGVKLVRGAYYNEDKYSGKLFITKENTDKEFNKGLDLIKKNQDNIKAFICTHNLKDINTLINSDINKNNIYHASLYGFLNNETNKIIYHNIKVYKYLPYGKIEDSIPYLTRRLYENPRVIFDLIK
jgi:hypothetical protein